MLVNKNFYYYFCFFSASLTVQRRANRANGPAGIEPVTRRVLLVMHGTDIRKSGTDARARLRYRTRHSCVNRSLRQLDAFVPIDTPAQQVKPCLCDYIY